MDFIGTLIPLGPPAELSNISVPEFVDPHPRHEDLRGADAPGGTRHVTHERLDMTTPKSLFAHDFSSTLSQLQLTSDPASAAVSTLIGTAPRPHDAAGLTHVCAGAHAAVTAVIEFLQDANPTAFDIALSVSALKERVLALTENCSVEDLASPRGRRLTKFHGWSSKWRVAS
jgi:hypothetical protein